MALSGFIWPGFFTFSGNVGAIDVLAFDRANQDVYLARVGTQDLGIYTGGTNGVGGTLRFDVSATAVTSALPIILSTDAYIRRSAAKTLTIDTDGAGGALTAVNVAATSLQLSTAMFINGTAPTVTAGFGSGVAGTVTFNTGTLAVVVTVGTNAGGTTGTITFPSAPHGWAVYLSDVTTTTDLTRQTGYTQTTATFSTTVAWTTGDVLVGIAVPF